MTRRLLLIGIFLITCFNGNGQQYDDLESLNGFDFKVYYSPGYESRASDIANRCENAFNYLNSVVDFTPEFQLFVLDSAVWKKYGEHPLFGMPHSFDSNLVVAARDNVFWKSFIPPLESLDPEFATKLKNTYSDSNQILTMQPFFDLLAIHELGHVFHLQANLKMQRLWMQELFVNIMLHTYVEENEPENLPALTLFPRMVIASGTEGFKYTTLEDFETRYDNMSGRNYGWFQSKLHSAANDIYKAAGTAALLKLWKGLKDNQQKMNDTEFINFLSEDVHPEVAKVYSEW